MGTNRIRTGNTSVLVNPETGGRAELVQVPVNAVPGKNAGNARFWKCNAKVCRNSRECGFLVNRRPAPRWRRGGRGPNIRARTGRLP